jgi:hypothetical protein
MPVLSQYWFSNQFFGGPFSNYNQPYPLGGWAWISRGGNSAATLSWNRQDNETIINFAQVLSNPLVTGPVDNIIHGDAHRSGPIQAQGVFWTNVPYYGSNPARHQPWDMLVRIFVPIHISTPWYCTDADGTVSYWLVFYLDTARHLHGHVDGWSYQYDGGGPFCTGGINDQLNAAVSGGVSTVQNLVDQAVGLLGAGTHSMLYYLPGSGSKAPGGRSENADSNVALVLLP